MESAADTPVLPLTLLDCRFDLDEPPRLSAFPGSAWRGVFGHALKRAVCVVRHTGCPACLLYRGCVYPYVFETPPPPDAAKLRLDQYTQVGKGTTMGRGRYELLSDTAAEDIGE